jgi:hypothetical protein
VIDFRYHALSFAAVFVALAIGFLLGATVGDTLVSSADRGLRSSLRADLQESRADAAALGEQVDRRDRLIAGVLPELAADRLASRRVAIVGDGSLPDEVESPSREAVELAGGAIDSVSALDPAENAEELATALDARAPRAIDDQEALELLGRQVGRALVLGRPARALEREAPDRIRGGLAGADAVVLYRAPEEPDDPESDQDDRRDRARDAFGKGLVEGMQEVGAPVVGAEDADADPSEVPWYEGRDLTSVDSVDTPGGQLALVYALDGSEGTFGLKDTAERPLPDLADLRG